MARTRKPQITELTFVLLGNAAYAIECPECRQLIGIGEAPIHTNGFRIDSHGNIAELVVCPNRIDGSYCDWAGAVRLVQQVDWLERL